MIKEIHTKETINFIENHSIKCSDIRYGSTEADIAIRDERGNIITTDLLSSRAAIDSISLEDYSLEQAIEKLHSAEISEKVIFDKPTQHYLAKIMENGRIFDNSDGRNVNDVNNVSFTPEAHKARNLLIESHLPLAVSLAKIQLGRGIPLQDLIDEAYIGLIKGITKYDSSRGTEISTFVTYWIRSELIRAVENHSSTIRIPTHLHELQRKVHKAGRLLGQQLSRPATDEEISDYLGILPAQVRNVNKVFNLLSSTTSLDQPIYANKQDSDHRWEDIIPDPVNLTETKDNQINEEEFKRIFLCLTPEEQAAVMLAYAHDSKMDRKSYEDTAQQLNLSRTPVSRLIKSAKVKIIESVQQQNIQGFEINPSRAIAKSKFRNTSKEVVADNYQLDENNYSEATQLLENMYLANLQLRPRTIGEQPSWYETITPMSLTELVVAELLFDNKMSENEVGGALHLLPNKVNQIARNITVKYKLLQETKELGQRLIKLRKQK